MSKKIQRYIRIAEEVAIQDKKAGKPACFEGMMHWLDMVVIPVCSMKKNGEEDKELRKGIKQMLDRVNGNARRQQELVNYQPTVEQGDPVQQSIFN